MEKIIYVKILKLIERKGPRFTTEELAKELGSSKRTIYNYFSSKDEMLEKTIDFVFEDISLIEEDIINDQDNTLIEKVEKSILAIPDAYSIGALLQHSDELERYYPELWKKVNCYIDSIWDVSIHLVKQGIQCGEIEPIDTSILKLILNETLKKLLDYQYMINNDSSFESGIQTIRKIILYGIFKR